MMAWDKIRVNGRGTAMVTIRETSIAFSSYFIKKEQLISVKYVELYEDIELRRLGFKFTDNTLFINALSLTNDGGKKGLQKSNGRVIYTDISKINWIKTAVERDGRRYSIRRDHNFQINSLFFIELGYSYSQKIDFDTIDLFPEISGVYRLFNQGNELLRIGEGQNIKTRLLVHKKNDFKNDIKSLDYCEIPDKLSRKKEERRLLVSFKEQHCGYLPFLNSITA